MLNDTVDNEDDIKDLEMTEIGIITPPQTLDN